MGVKRRRVIYSTEETDFIAIRNIERINNILDNPNDYSLKDLMKLGRKELHGVSSELRDKLEQLGIKKAVE